MRYGRVPLLAAFILSLGRVSAADVPPLRFEVPIEVRGLPEGAPFVPLSNRVDFSAWLEEMSVAGAVDERSLRLYREDAGGKLVEEPVQFDPEPQPRPKGRPELPGRPEGISDLGEYRAGETPAGLRVVGTLRWVALGGGDARYRLTFAVPREGYAVQVPYPPWNLRQFDANGRATPLPGFPHVRVEPVRPIAGRVEFRLGAEPFSTAYLGPTDDPPAAGVPRRPFLYPVRGPDGDPLTGFGKPHDPTGSHDHHDSLWVAHADVDGLDFWSEKGGAIVHEALEETEEGPVLARLVQRTRWVHSGAVRLRERRTWTLHRTPADVRALDLDLEWGAPAGRPVTLGRTTFGPLAVRVAPTLSVFDGGGEIRNARGDVNERGAHLRAAEWIELSGPSGPGRVAGVALLDHPENPGHPTAWHCRNDGWAGAALNASGPIRIEPGRPLRLRYRVLLHRGDADSAAVARQHAAFAARPTIAVGRPVPLPH